MNLNSELNRRSFIKGAGAGVLLISGGMIWSAEAGVLVAEEGSAYELWKRPWPSKPGNGSAEDLVAAAVLAANPHNTQPWLFRIGKDRIELYADRSRRLKAIDPDERELMLGLGCALENLALAAQAFGYNADVSLLPRGAQNDLVANLMLQHSEPSPSQLYQMIPKRRTNRARYSGKPIPERDLAELARFAESDTGLRVHLYVKDAERRAIGEAINRACEMQAKDSAQHAETASWFRKNDKEIQERKDGITIDAGGNPYFMRVLAKIFISDKMIHGPSFGNTFVKNTKTQAESASAFAIISGENKLPEMCLRGGRLFQRIHLWATSRGIAMQPMNYPLENRPELRTEVTALIGGEGREALIPFRLGYGPGVPHSPRRAIKDVVIP